MADMDGFIDEAAKGLGVNLNLRSADTDTGSGDVNDNDEADCDDDDTLERRQMPRQVGTVVGIPGEVINGVTRGSPAGAGQYAPVSGVEFVNGMPVQPPIPFNPQMGPMQGGYPASGPPFQSQMQPPSFPSLPMGEVAGEAPSPVSGAMEEAQGRAPFSEVANVPNELEGAASVLGQTVQNTPAGAVFGVPEGIIGGSLLPGTPDQVAGVPGLAIGSIPGLGSIAGGMAQDSPEEQIFGEDPLFGGSLGSLGLVAQGAAPQPPQSGDVTSRIPAGALPTGIPVSPGTPSPPGAPAPPAVPVAPGAPAPPNAPTAPGAPDVPAPPGISVAPGVPVPPKALVPASAPAQPPSMFPNPVQGSEAEDDLPASPSSTTATPASSPQVDDDYASPSATPASTPLMGAFAHLAGQSSVPPPPVSPPMGGLPVPSGAPPLPVHPPVSGAPQSPVNPTGAPQPPAPPAQPPVQPPVSPPVPAPSAPLQLGNAAIHPPVSPPIAPPSAPVNPPVGPPSSLPVQPPVSSLPGGVPTGLPVSPPGAPKPPVNPPAPPVSPAVPVPAGAPSGAPAPPKPPVSAPVPVPAPSAPSPPIFMRAKGRRQPAPGNLNLPLPSGFTAPTAPIAGDTPPLLQPSGGKQGASSPTGSMRSRAYAYFAPTLSKKGAKAVFEAREHDDGAANAGASGSSSAVEQHQSPPTGRRRLFRFSRFFAGGGD